MRYVKLLIVLSFVGLLQAVGERQYWYHPYLTWLRLYAPWLFSGAILGAGAGAGAHHFTGTPMGPSLVAGTATGLMLGGLSRKVYRDMSRDIFGQRGGQGTASAVRLGQARAVLAKSEEKKMEDTRRQLLHKQKLQKIWNDRGEARKKGNNNEFENKKSEWTRVHNIGWEKWYEQEGSKSQDEI